MSKWKCSNCGYVFDGDELPTQCPKCDVPKDAYQLLDERATKLVERSRRTNALHCRLVSLAREIETVCADGIDDKLDPGCVDLFRKSLDHAHEMMKLAMTEMKIHADKGKWG